MMTGVTRFSSAMLLLAAGAVCADSPYSSSSSSSASSSPATSGYSSLKIEIRNPELLGVEPLVLKAAGDKAKPMRPISEFKPSRDSFAFANHFDGLPVKSTLLDRAGQAYGLCGGMSFAATDFFLAKFDLPEQKSAPQKNSPLWNYLFSRQTETLNNGTAEKFVLWTSLDDSGKLGVPALTLPQAEAAKKLLDAGLPAVLGLIQTDDAMEIFTNHQILAYAYEEKEGTTTFHTYDPNFPRDDNRIVTVETFEQIALGEKIACAKTLRGSSKDKTLRTIRGFFVLPYAARDPQKMDEKVKSSKVRS
jgi:hypothetical protein